VNTLLKTCVLSFDRHASIIACHLPPLGILLMYNHHWVCRQGHKIITIQYCWVCRQNCKVINDIITCIFPIVRIGIKSCMKVIYHVLWQWCCHSVSITVFLVAWHCFGCHCNCFVVDGATTLALLLCCHCCCMVVVDFVIAAWCCHNITLVVDNILNIMFHSTT